MIVGCYSVHLYCDFGIPSPDKPSHGESYTLHGGRPNYELEQRMELAIRLREFAEINAYTTNAEFACGIELIIETAEMLEQPAGPDRSSVLEEAAKECDKAARIYRAMQTYDEGTPAEDAREAEELARGQEITAQMIRALKNAAPQVIPSGDASALTVTPSQTAELVSSEIVDALWEYSEYLHRDGQTSQAAGIEAVIHRLKNAPQPEAGKDDARDAERYRFLRAGSWVDQVEHDSFYLQFHEVRVETPLPLTLTEIDWLVDEARSVATAHSPGDADGK